MVKNLLKYYYAISKSTIYPVIRFRISFVKVIIIPPANVRNPFALWDGSWDFRDKPTCTIPKPSRIKPMALIKLKIKLDRLFTTVSGSSAARQVPTNTVATNTSTA